MARGCPLRAPGSAAIARRAEGACEIADRTMGIVKVVDRIGNEACREALAGRDQAIRQGEVFRTRASRPFRLGVARGDQRAQQPDAVAVMGFLLPQEGCPQRDESGSEACELGLRPHEGDHADRFQDALQAHQRGGQVALLEIPPQPGLVACQRAARLVCSAVVAAQQGRRRAEHRGMARLLLRLCHEKAKPSWVGREGRLPSGDGARQPLRAGERREERRQGPALRAAHRRQVGGRHRRVPDAGPNPPIAGGRRGNAEILVISVIMPVYDEAKALPGTLRALLAQSGSFEVIVVDGGSSDDTLAIAGAHGVTVLQAPKGRAAQMNAGAAQARGDMLLFLHADTRLPVGALAHLDALAATRSCDAGAFRHSFDPPSWSLRLVSWLTNLRCRLTRVYYGDQAMFVRADLFRQLGGFPDVTVLEDVIFCEKLRRATRPKLLRACVVTDGRRFLQFGTARMVLRGLVILARHKLRLPVEGREFSDHVR